MEQNVPAESPTTSEPKTPEPRRVASLSTVSMQGLDANAGAATPGMHCGFAVLGGSPGTRQYDLVGFALGVLEPRVVICQPRQSLNSNLNCADVFVVQVVSTSRTTIRVVVAAADGGGWGQALRLDVMVVE